jgi:hypothetical protein
MNVEIEAELFGAIRTGDLATLDRLLAEYPAIAGARLSVAGGRTPLHVTADWPGYFPQAPAAVHRLIDAGADPNVRGEDGTGETPLHWAASSDDLEVAVALVDRGADIDAPDGSIGTPLENAIGYGCWHVARLLYARGATVNGLWQAAALGLTDEVQRRLAADPPPTVDNVSEALWQACHGGQLRTATLLRDRGADIGFKPDYANGPNTIIDIASEPDTRRSQLVEWLRQQGA